MATLRLTHRTGFQFGSLTIMILLLGLATFPVTDGDAGFYTRPMAMQVVSRCIPPFRDGSPASMTHRGGHVQPCRST